MRGRLAQRNKSSPAIQARVSASGQASAVVRDRYSYMGPPVGARASVQPVRGGPAGADAPAAAGRPRHRKRLPGEPGELKRNGKSASSLIGRPAFQAGATQL